MFGVRLIRVTFTESGWDGLVPLNPNDQLVPLILPGWLVHQVRSLDTSAVLIL